MSTSRSSKTAASEAAGSGAERDRGQRDLAEAGVVARDPVAQGPVARDLEESNLVEVAVPVPLRHPLTYALPASYRDGLSPGVRVRVPVGKRKLVGMVLGPAQNAPSGVEPRKILEVLDREPAVPGDLLQLARFMADYYLAPIGDAVRSMLPAGLPPWGDRQIRLTDRGALAPSRDPLEGKVVGALLERGRLRVAELEQHLEHAPLAPLIEKLADEGRLVLEEPGRRGGRYVRAVELKGGKVQELLERCGRAPQGRAVIQHLAAVGRPLTVPELKSAVGCGPAAIRRLEKLGLLRSFTQLERISLARHRLSEEQREPLVLRPDQESARHSISQALAAKVYSPFLLYGVTGSGKTEVYLRIAAECLEQGRAVILMVPEIALVPALARAVTARFGAQVALLHSNLSASERQQEWERVRRGEARLVLGPRSALFAPVQQLGLVVVDEEHDVAYKQDSSPRYNARDLALMRARQHDAVAVLASATPSMESRRNIQLAKLSSLSLTERAGLGRMPEGILVDLRNEAASKRPGEVHFSAVLRAEVDSALRAGDQVILLRNRRGYSPLLLCRACGEEFRCPDCGLPRTFHRRQRQLLCHYCGDLQPLPARCPECGEAALEPMGAGTERVEEDFRELFPDTVVDVLDADSARRPGGAAAVLERFGSGRSQVLIGTQMVAKGHDFPRVALAAVLFADTYLSFPDFRAVERTYNLLTQLGGRAGRGDRPGRMVIQTYHPDHYAIRAALAHDDKAFAAEEHRYRRAFHYPPYTRMVQLMCRHQRRERAQSLLQEIADQVLRHPLAAGVRIAGPAPAPLERLRGKWRFQMLLRAASAGHLRRLLEAVLGSQPPSELSVDIDPIDLM